MREQKLARTLYHRIRPLPDICSPHPGHRAYAERQAVNSVIQGTASDIAKRAMISIHSQLRQLQLSAGRQQQQQPFARLTLQVHDEIIVETEADWLQQVACIMRRCMEAVFCPPEAALPFPVSIKVGPTLGALVPWEPQQEDATQLKQERETATVQLLAAEPELVHGVPSGAAAVRTMEEEEEEEALWDASHWDQAAAGLTPSSQGMQLSEASTCISSYASFSSFSTPATAPSHPYSNNEQQQQQQQQQRRY